jgi:hypothetical protein
MGQVGLYWDWLRAGLGLNSLHGKGFLSSPLRPDQLYGQLNVLPDATGVIFPWLKAVGAWSRSLTPCSAEVKNMSRCVMSSRHVMQITRTFLSEYMIQQLLKQKYRIGEAEKRTVVDRSIRLTKRVRDPTFGVNWQIKVKNKLSLGKACCHSVLNLSPSRRLLWCIVVKPGLSSQEKNTDWEVWKRGVIISGAKRS